MSVDDIFLEKAHEKELYLTKKLIKSLFKKYFRREKEIRNELKERIFKFGKIIKKIYSGANFELHELDVEGEISSLLKNYEDLRNELIKELKPTLTSLKDKPYKKEIVLILRKNFKELNENRTKKLSKILKSALNPSNKVMEISDKETRDEKYIFLRAKTDYGILWHGTTIQKFGDIIQGGFFRERLFLTHDEQWTSDGYLNASEEGGKVTLIIDVRGLSTEYEIWVKQKELIIKEKVPIKRILKIYVDKENINKVKEILSQKNINIPIHERHGSEFKEDEKRILEGVNKLTELYLTKYKKLGLSVKTLKEKLEYFQQSPTGIGETPEEDLEVWLSGY